jgi:hypothetical protein
MVCSVTKSFYSPTGGTPPAPTFFSATHNRIDGKNGRQDMSWFYIPRRFALVRVACTGSSIRGLDDLPL